MKQKFIFLTILFAVVATTFISAQADRTISVQGILREASGIAVEDGNYTLEFNIYHDPTNMDSKWDETHTDVPVKNGLYTVYLGENTAIPVSVFDTVNVAYVGVTIGGSEMTPRIRMTHAPFTFTSQTVTCSGAVGDIKYSILPPADFEKENGSCWEPLDGASFPSSTLAVKYGWNTLPDASGLFLRAHEYNEAYDNDRTTNSPIATVQAEDVGPHQHNFTGNGSTSTDGNHRHSISASGSDDLSATNSTTDRVLNNDDGSNVTDYTNYAGNHSHSVTVSGTTNINAGTETRPDNLNLYIYIRIN